LTTRGSTILQYEPLRQLRKRDVARLVAWIMLVSGILVLTPVWLWLRFVRPQVVQSWQTFGYDFSGSILGRGWLLLGLLLLAVSLLLRTTPPTALRLSPRWSALLILAGTAALQASAICAGQRARLSTDALRYRTEGAMWLAGISPVRRNPDVFRLRGAAVRIRRATLQRG
jgi:hypothetical protein